MRLPRPSPHPSRPSRSPVLRDVASPYAGRDRSPSSRMSRRRDDAAACCAASGSEGAAVAMTSNTSATVTSSRSSDAARARSTSCPTTSSSAAAPASSAGDVLGDRGRALLHEAQVGRNDGVPLLRNARLVPDRARRVGRLVGDADAQHVRRQQPPRTGGDGRAQEARQRRPRLVLLAEGGPRLVGQPGGLLLGYAPHQYVLAREAPVHRADTDPGPPRHVLHRRAVPQLAEDLARRAQDVLQIALGIHPERRRTRAVARAATATARGGRSAYHGRSGSRRSPLRVLNVHMCSPGNDVSPRRLSPPSAAGA